MHVLKAIIWLEVKIRYIQTRLPSAIYEIHLVLLSYPFSHQGECTLGSQAPAAGITEWEKALRRAGSVEEVRLIRSMINN